MTTLLHRILHGAVTLPLLSLGMSQSPLLQASIDGNAVDLEAARLAGEAVGVRNEVNATALMFAASSGGGCDLVRVLLDAGADPNLVSDPGMTALLYARVYFAGPEVVQALVDAGSRIEARTTDDSTPLMLPRPRDSLATARRYKVFVLHP